jgi:hypothetical protein
VAQSYFGLPAIERIDANSPLNESVNTWEKSVKLVRDFPTELGVPGHTYSVTGAEVRAQAAARAKVTRMMMDTASRTIGGSHSFPVSAAPLVCGPCGSTFCFFFFSGGLLYALSFLQRRARIALYIVVIRVRTLVCIMASPICIETIAPRYGRT